MSDIDTSGPAFPAPGAGESHFGDAGAYMGLTKREWFAGKALQGLLANPKLADEIRANKRWPVDAAIAWAGIIMKALDA